VATVADRVEATPQPVRRPAAGVGLLRGARANWQLTAGLGIVGGIILLGIVGQLAVGSAGLQLGSAPFSRPPLERSLLGTDALGRDVATYLVHAIPPTLTIGLIAAFVGTLIGTVCGLLTGFFRGPTDSVIRTSADVAMNIPALAVLIVIASLIRTTSVELMALVVALFAWPYTTRTIRAQTLSLREQAFVQMARLSGRGEFEIAFKELLPNLLPYIIAGFVGAVSAGILASVGLQLLGLGPLLTPTLGLMLQESFNAGALVRGLWWWWGPPTLVLCLLFLGLFLTSLGLDSVANPRMRRVRGQVDAPEVGLGSGGHGA
jgi:peptide/nickel transport system permease protein